ncbi:D-alanyl-D-alanine carboxypeptidase family protein [Evansella sp. AB-rgal1]|uniref:D-alanyl-D-alanine carboxypeptidase family protein n=1 Tax=Evansella sp. AB-rgal1 TaxID=3242696 RepID=UPI00359CECAE
MRNWNNAIFIFTILTLSISLIIIPITSNAQGNPNLNSEAAILMDRTTGELIYEKNADNKMYPASLTKIVTAIIAIETQDLSEIVTVSNKAIRAIGTRVYLLEDEQVTLEQLLHGLMVSSGNDAAIAIAEHIDGSVEEFSKRMNQFIKNRIGVKNSNFSNPHGLYGEDNYTTAKDMALISAYAMGNETFRQLVSTEFVDWIGEGWETRIYNHHPLLRAHEEIIGIKNGFISQSGYTLATAAVVDNTELIVVTLNSTSRNTASRDTLALFQFGFENYETQWISFNEEPLLTNFIFPHDLPYTTYKEEVLHYTISEDGYVTIEGDNRIIDIVELEKREPLHLPNFSFDKIVETLELQKNQEVNSSPSWKEWLLITGFYFFIYR